MTVFDPVDALFDRFVVADVEDREGEGLPVRIAGGFHQLVFTLQIPHCCYDCEQMEGKREEKYLLVSWFKFCIKIKAAGKII